jgi:hypothetical protein
MGFKKTTLACNCCYRLKHIHIIKKMWDILVIHRLDINCTSKIRPGIASIVTRISEIHILPSKLIHLS